MVITCIQVITMQCGRKGPFDPLLRVLRVRYLIFSNTRMSNNLYTSEGVHAR